MPGTVARFDPPAISYVPSDASLEDEINTWLRTNPETLILSGGAIAEDLGRYGDGVYLILQTLSERRGFDFDRASIPLPRPTVAGSVG